MKDSGKESDIFFVFKVRLVKPSIQEYINTTAVKKIAVTTKTFK